MKRFAIISVALLAACGLAAANQTVLVQTSILIDPAKPATADNRVSFALELLADDAPLTVANFLNYIDSGRYDNTIMHRSVIQPSPFVLQAGGFSLDPYLAPVETDAPVPNEFGISNTRGTVAMAKLGDDPNSATSQWFVNLGNNSANLDTQNGGFTVFARVISDMNVVDFVSGTTPATAIPWLQNAYDSENGSPVSPVTVWDMRQDLFNEGYPYASAFGEVPVVHQMDYFSWLSVTQVLRAGDINGDGIVDLSDLGIMGRTWGTAPAEAHLFWFAGDLNADGTVDAADLALLGENWGLDVTDASLTSFAMDADTTLDGFTATAIPEPASLLLAGLAGLGLLRRRRA